MLAKFTISQNKIICSGNWTIRHIEKVQEKFSQLKNSATLVDAHSINSLDSSGALVLLGLGLKIETNNVRHKNLLAALQHISNSALKDSPKDLSEENMPHNFFDSVKKIFRSVVHDIILMLHILGESLAGIVFRPTKGRGVRITSIVFQLDIIGLRAVPVITVMAFLIGGVIAQQGAFLLEAYGEQLLTVSLLGILHLREIGILLTAIMVSGRSGSSITAELGTMKMREEMDALSVMGFNPISVLILPRMIALVIALPILTLLADLAGLLGGMIVAYYYINVPPIQFIFELHNAIDLTTVFAGLIKAPFMALVIALIAFVEGLKVDASAESLGYRTTVSVVRCIFAVIVIDCLFALFYAAIGF